MVVDEAQEVLLQVKSVLEGHGYGVVCVQEGADTLHRARKILPDLILLDCGLNHMPVRALCKALSKDSVLQGIPVVAMRGADEKRLKRNMDIDDHISKPLEAEALLAVVQHTLKKSRLPSFRRWAAAETSELIGDLLETKSLRGLARRVVEAMGGGQGAKAKVDQVQTVLESADAMAEMGDVWLEAGKRPALRGDLAVVPIAEVLQLLALQRQTGFLDVRYLTQSVRLAFERGEVRQVSGAGMAEEFLLGEILVREGFVQRDDLDILLEKPSGQRLGAQVVALGYVNAEMLHEAMRQQSCEMLYEMLRWGWGAFAFFPHEHLPEEAREFDFDLGMEGLLMEGYRRVDEWGLIEQALPSLEVVLCARQGRSGHVVLTAEEEMVLALVNAERTARAIIAAAGLGTFQGARLLYRLLSAHVVEQVGDRLM